MTIEVMIQQPGHGADELTSGTLSDNCIKVLRTLHGKQSETWIGQLVTVSSSDENGNPVEFDGKLVDVM